ncbi:MAG: hypothetical protein NTZ05_09665 [Chloroflexi bacterium]|nr:hypothetical protein [Chloroflexota bacterium]
MGERLDEFLLATYRLTPDNLHHYTRRLALRTAPYLVPIEPDFPHITNNDLLTLPHHDMARVSDVQYRVLVDGLGWEDGSPEFTSIIPVEMRNA